MERPDGNLVVEWNINEANLARIRVFVAEPYVTPPV